MYKNIIMVVFLAIAGAVPAFAENSVVIDQVGSGSVYVRQNGEGNSVKINQEKAEQEIFEKEGKTAKTNIPGKPPAYMSFGERARATQVISSQAPANSKNNKINVKQNGTRNSAKLSQNGENNDILLKQEGRKNQYKKQQKGKHNKTKVIQNDKLIEE